MRAFVLAAIALAAAGCNKGTYLVLQLQGSDTGIHSVEVHVSLPDGTSGTTTLAEKSGADIVLPTTATLDFGGHSGHASVTAVARDASGNELDNVATAVDVPAGHTVTLPLTFGTVASDDLGSGDLAGTDAAPGSVPLTVSLAGNGSGSVTSMPAGIDCGATCTTMFAPDTMVTLTAAPTLGSVVGSWLGDCAGSEWSCTVTMSQARNVTLTLSKINFMFVTSTALSSGNLGGLAGADGICMTRAQAAGMTGTFKAWLCSSTSTAVARLGSARGWIRRDGKPFADQRTDMIQSTFSAANVDEFGNEVGAGLALTGCYPDGTWGGQSCGAAGAEWTDGTATKSAYTGDVNGGSGCWQYHATGGTHIRACNATDPALRIYCFQTDYNTPLTFPRAKGRYAFVSAEPWDPLGTISTGTPSADALCAKEATAASLPGSYKAFLATPTAAASARFSAAGAPWVRTDGIPLVAKPSDLLGSVPKLLAPFTLAPDGTTYSHEVFTGAFDPSSAGSTMTGGMSTTCNNWTLDTSGANAAVGEACLVGLQTLPPVSTFFAMTNYGSTEACNLQPSGVNDPHPHIYCLQE